MYVEEAMFETVHVMNSIKLPTKLATFKIQPITLQFNTILQLSKMSSRMIYLVSKFFGAVNSLASGL